jgi:hypothetical protein
MTAFARLQDSPTLQVRRTILLTILALIVISLTVFVVLVLRYQPALSVAPGYDSHCHPAPLRSSRHSDPEF